MISRKRPDIGLLLAHIARQGDTVRADRLSQALRSLILQGQLVSNDQLPSSRQLARDVGISRSTVETAYEQLADEQLLDRRLGSGTFVTIRSEVTSALPSIHTTRTTQTRAPRRHRLSARGRAMRLGSSQATTIFKRHETPRGKENSPVGFSKTSFPFKQWASHLQWALSALETQEERALCLEAEKTVRQCLAEQLNLRQGIACHADDLLLARDRIALFRVIVTYLCNPGDSAFVDLRIIDEVTSSLRATGLEVTPFEVEEARVRENGPLSLFGAAPRVAIVCEPSIGTKRSPILPMPISKTSANHSLPMWWVNDLSDAFWFRVTHQDNSISLSPQASHRILTGSLQPIMGPLASIAFAYLPIALRRDIASLCNHMAERPETLSLIALSRFIGSGQLYAYLRERRLATGTQMALGAIG
jgi:GntR family transcriptional regulator / MocR family aminotransferase